MFKPRRLLRTGWGDTAPCCLSTRAVDAFFGQACAARPKQSDSQNQAGAEPKGSFASPLRGLLDAHFQDLCPAPVRFQASFPLRLPGEWTLPAVKPSLPVCFCIQMPAFAIEPFEASRRLNELVQEWQGCHDMLCRQSSAVLASVGASGRVLSK